MLYQPMATVVSIRPRVFATLCYHARGWLRSGSTCSAILCTASENAASSASPARKSMTQPTILETRHRKKRTFIGDEPRASATPNSQHGTFATPIVAHRTTQHRTRNTGQPNPRRRCRPNRARRPPPAGRSLTGPSMTRSPKRWKTDETVRGWLEMVSG